MVGVAHASVAEIDEINILQASHLAMVRAIENLPKPADFALIDGNRARKIDNSINLCRERMTDPVHRGRIDCGQDYAR